MTAVETPTAQLTENQLGLLFQYTVEAYKTFEKLAEKLPNPLAAAMFKAFALDERANRDLLDMKSAAAGGSPLRVTLGGDLLFEDILEGDLSYRETAEFLIARERTMEKKLAEWARSASPVDRGLLIYLGASKRAHIVELERELELIKIDPAWFQREDAGGGDRRAAAEEPIADDRVLDVDGVRVALDAMAADRLDGAVITYDDEEDGYAIAQPDAVSAVW